METDQTERGPLPVAGTVLIIDDNPDLCAMYAAGLTQGSLAVATASDVEAGWTAATTICPDVILLDIGLADGNGLDLLDRLRAHTWSTRAPRVVMFTNFDDPAYRARAQAAGAEGYMVKASVRIQQLAATVRALLASPGRPAPG